MPTELLAGLTVALALVPEAVAFAFVAGVHPLVGLYAAFIVGLITALIERDLWADVNFSNLGSIHLPSSFNRFEGRRDLSEGGRFRPVEPLEPDD